MPVSNKQFLLYLKLPSYVSCETPFMVPLVGPPGHCGQKGPVGSILQSIHVAVIFLGIGSLVFSETQLGVRGPYLVICDTDEFLRKKPHRVKITKNDQKWPKNRIFGLFKKIKSLLLSGIGVKQKVLMALNHFYENCMPKKNLVLRLYGQKWLSTNEISVVFNCQYFINRLMSDFDFWNVVNHE